jgi:hypothetical protein
MKRNQVIDAAKPGQDLEAVLPPVDGPAGAFRPAGVKGW